MATRPGTIEYFFPMLSTASDAVDTDFAQITVRIDQTVIAFRSVILEVYAQDANTTLGNISRRQVSLRLGAAAYTVSNNTNLLTQSSEQFAYFTSADFTAHFAANWAGPSMTCDARVLIDSAVASPLAQRNITARLVITYDYDDTSTVFTKTVRLPLDAPSGALATAKPGTATSVIPALDTFLAESGKTIRGLAIVCEGNSATVGTADHSLSVEVDTLGVRTSQLIEAAANTDMFVRFVFDMLGVFSTSAAHDFFLWGSVAKFNHFQVYMVVTYSCDRASARATVSAMLPAEFSSPSGGTASADYQTARRDIWVPEENISNQRIAFYLFFDQIAAVAGINARIGTGSFVAYTDTAATLAGSNALMIRNDSAFTLSHGRNQVNVDVYRTDASDLIMNASGYWMIVYSCDVPAGGLGVVTSTVMFSVLEVGTSAAANMRVSSAIAFDLPSEYFVGGCGLKYAYLSNSTASPAGVSVQVERLAAEGYHEWMSAYADISQTDPEVGVRLCYAQVRDLFFRWSGDPDASRVDLETARRWRATLANSATSFDQLTLVLVLHGVAYAFAGTITGFSGTVTLNLHRESTGEIVATTTRSGDGAYSFDWWDDTEPLFVSASDGVNVGRSLSGVAV